MYCPNCATETSEDTKYCRNCGVDLQLVSNLLTGRLQFAPPDASTMNAQGHSGLGRRKVLSWGFATFWGGIVLAALLGALGSAFWTVDDNLGRFIGELAPLGAIVMLIGVGIMIYSRFIPKPEAAYQQPKPLAKQGVNPPLQLDSQPRVPVSSVTDNTTELLEASDTESRWRKRGRRSE